MANIRWDSTRKYASGMEIHYKKHFIKKCFLKYDTGYVLHGQTHSLRPYEHNVSSANASFLLFCVRKVLLLRSHVPKTKTISADVVSMAGCKLVLFVVFAMKTFTHAENDNIIDSSIVESTDIHIQTTKLDITGDSQL